VRELGIDVVVGIVGGVIGICGTMFAIYTGINANERRKDTDLTNDVTERAIIKVQLESIVKKIDELLAEQKIQSKLSTVANEKIAVIEKDLMAVWERIKKIEEKCD
jgi:peptidoglycan hydrolase CwlO-like protein